MYNTIYTEQPKYKHRTQISIYSHKRCGPHSTTVKEKLSQNTNDNNPRVNLEEDNEGARE